MRKAKERTIYDNYDLWNDYAEEAKDYLMYNECIENPTEDDIWDTISFLDSGNWETEESLLIDFFNGSTWILQGYTGRWDGRHRGGYIFTSFKDMFHKATKDCDYIRIYDENGHLFLKCSHHDGTNLYEIKKVTEKGVEYINRWKSNWEDNRNEEHVHDMVMKKYSTLPHYVYNVYGRPKVEYIKGESK